MFLIPCWLIRQYQASRKMLCGRSRPRGAGFWCEVKVTVRAGKDRVNTQELCKCEILFRGFARRNADQVKVEFGSPKRFELGVRDDRQDAGNSLLNSTAGICTADSTGIAEGRGQIAEVEIQDL